MSNWKLFVRRYVTEEWLEWDSYGNLEQASIAARNLHKEGLQTQVLKVAL